MDEKRRQEVGLFRIAVLGPLVGARLEHGDLVKCCREAAERAWERPDGEVIEVSARTIEDWYYAYQQGGFAALLPKERSDRRASHAIAAELAELILRLKREKLRRSVKRIIRILERAKKVERDTLTKSASTACSRPMGSPGGPGVARAPSGARSSTSTPGTSGWGTASIPVVR